MLVELLISLIHSTNLSNIFLDYILHYIPPQIYILFYHCQCLEFYPKQTMLLLEFIVLSKDTIIIEGFYSLGLLQNLLQPFIKSHLPLQKFIHLCLLLVRLPFYIIFGLVYITNIHFELLSLLLLFQKSLFHILLIPLKSIMFHT